MRSFVYCNTSTNVQIHDSIKFSAKNSLHYGAHRAREIRRARDSQLHKGN